MSENATERLRELLDERGVKWEDDTPVLSMKPWKTSFTSFTGEEVSIGCYDEMKWIMGTLVFHTPEQAIAATLGTGTCRDVCAGLSEFTCSECGFNCDLTSWISLFDGDEGRHRHHHHGTPNFCPNCGRKVVDE